MEKLAEILEEQQRVTQKALDRLNTILNEINELYPNENIWVGNIRVKRCKKTNSGFSFCGYSYEPDDEVGGFIPESVDDLNKGFYYAGDYNCWVEYINKKQLLYIMNNINSWILNLKEKESKFTKELEEILGIK